ncbi:MAG: Na+/H+ antiporter NhaA [Actinomycetaceae bacterium]|nr:Na+/H+ antiporter NhaA [Actinomycetaceae bacterium]
MNAHSDNAQRKNPDSYDDLHEPHPDDYYVDAITRKKRAEYEKKHPGKEPEYQDLVPPYSDLPSDYEEYGLATRLKAALANDIIAGMILIVAAALALFFANSPWRDIYEAISHYEIGFDSIHLSLSINHWAQDGLLTLFFFAVGLELKQEFVTGSLRDPRTAALPIISAVFGMAGPAAVYVTIISLSAHDALQGWAIPTATDIAFAVAILQIFGRGLPLAARTFLLTLAVADDLGGILVIALFYSSGIQVGALFLSFIVVAVFAFLVRKRILLWWLLIPLGILAWYFMHASGVHATISGVLLGMVVPAKEAEGESLAMTERFIELVNPFSAGLAVPIFAFFAAGVNIVDSPGGPSAMLSEPVTLAVGFALPLGKVIGIFGCVFLFTKLTGLRLGEGVSYGDVLPISFIAGIGFTVALLISHLAFQGNAELTSAGSLGVVLGTLLSTILGAVTLQMRVRYLRTHDDT